MRRYLLLLLLGSMLFSISVRADDFVVCDPTDQLVPNRVVRYQRNEDIFKTGVIANPNAFIYSDPSLGGDSAWDGKTPGGEPRHWKCAFRTVLGKGIFFNGVVTMSQAEQDALDAPTPEQLKQQEYQSEIQKGECQADLAALETEIAKAADLDALKLIVIQEARCRRALQQ